MRALVTPGGNPAVTLSEVPDPQPLPFQAVVEVAATSVNRGEVRRLGEQPAGFVSGWDLAGTVVRGAADGSGPPEGARVVALVPSGAWAERVAVATQMLCELPDGIGFATAAALPIAGLTALRALLAAGPLLGRRVLVTGAAGGVGRFAVQLAAIGGAHVTAVARSPERAQGLENLGAAAVVIGPGTPDDGRFDVILESVGGRSLAAAMRAVEPYGIVVAFGDSSAEPVELRAREFYRTPGARVYALMVFPELMREGSTARDLGTLLEYVAAGRLDPQVADSVPWTQASSAFDRLLRRDVPGKLVMTMKEIDR